MQKDWIFPKEKFKTKSVKGRREVEKSHDWNILGVIDAGKIHA